MKISFFCILEYSCNTKSNLKIRFKGSSDPSHFISEINVGKSRIRHRTTLILNGVIFNRFWVDLEIQFQSCSKSDSPLSDVDFKNYLFFRIFMTFVIMELKCTSELENARWHCHRKLATIREGYYRSIRIIEKL